MTNPYWNPDDYKFTFPDEPAVEGDIVNFSIIQKIEKIRIFLLQTIFVEARNCLHADSELAALLLAIASVEYLAGYYVGKQSQRNDFISFLTAYFPDQYAPYYDAIYDQLRCGLVHNLNVMNPWKKNGIDFLIHPNSPNHLKLNDEGKLIFSITLFLEDIRRAFWMYIHDVVEKQGENQELVENFIKRFNRVDGRGALMIKIPN
ncbi:MAG: hypothetical protein HY781_12835 [Chloroflexi bacterium]|nr:hypothetical protein [Chloroflexota bacterium]